MTRVVALIQARTSSTRLPGKVLLPIGGIPMIRRVLDQVAGARTVDECVVVTSVDPSDDQLAEWLAADGWAVFRGSLEDVLSRFADAARASNADVVVRVTADCPLHSPDTIDEVVEEFLSHDVDYASNTEPYSRPDGQDVEVFSADALRLAATHASPGPDREHVTPFLRRSALVRRLYYSHKKGPVGGHLRWSVDDAADLEHARTVWSRLDAIGSGPHSYEAIMGVVAERVPTTSGAIANEGYYKSLFDAADDHKASPRPLAQSETWLERSSRVIPGGAQTYSKSWRQHIRGVSPIFLERGAGARAWDVDGNEYVDLIQGLLPNILGYAEPAVDRAAYEQATRGHSFSLANPIEVVLAERLVRIIPCAEMVRFGKNGSDATAGAVRAARAFTGRERVAVCGYHGWQDWYIGSTSRIAGVPAAVRQLTHTFPYNNLEALDQLLSEHRGEFAAVVMEPFNFFWPEDGYLEGVREIAHRHGALLVFDEICTGFHLGLGGAQQMFGVTPDLATFGKAMGNGYPISCIVGRSDVMRAFDEVFVSFTFAGDASAMAASMAVLDILENTDAYLRMESAGRKLADGAITLAGLAGLGSRFSVQGHHNWSLIRFLTPDGADDPLLKTVWAQEVTRRGILVLATHNICAALDGDAVEHVLRAYAAAFKRVGTLVREGADLASELDGPIPTPAFRARA